MDRIHLRDAKKPLSRERQQARNAAVSSLERDFVERGAEAVADQLGPPPVDAPCSLHAIPLHAFAGPGPRDPERWPTGLRDRELAKAAVSHGSHVFLTEDSGILSCRGTLERHGVAILTPRELIERLEASGELETEVSPFMVPDLSALSRLYEGFGIAL